MRMLWYVLVRIGDPHYGYPMFYKDIA